MPIKFLKPGGNNFTVDLCEKNLNLLAHAQMIELDIGSECGGHGVCGGDRVRIATEGADLYSPITDDEKRHLSEAELAEGWRLACQCFPEESDLSLEIRTRS